MSFLYQKYSEQWSSVCETAQKRLRDLKGKISAQSKKNFVLERDVRYLDSRIALLIQNRMALDEVFRFLFFWLQLLMMFGSNARWSGHWKKWTQPRDITLMTANFNNIPICFSCSNPNHVTLQPYAALSRFPKSIPCYRQSCLPSMGTSTKAEKSIYFLPCSKVYFLRSLRLLQSLDPCSAPILLCLAWWRRTLDEDRVKAI